MLYYNIDFKNTVAATSWVTNAEADNYLKVEFDVSAENTLIDNLIKTAEEMVERFCNLCVSEKEVTVRITNIEIENTRDLLEFKLPFRGTISDLVVKTVDEGVETTLADTSYYIKGRNVLVLKDLNSFLLDLLITYTVTPSNTPITLKGAILKLVGDFYVNRTNDSIVSVTRISENTKAMLLQFEDSSGWI